MSDSIGNASYMPAQPKQLDVDYNQQEKINSLMDIINKKKELLNSLNELNKKVELDLFCVVLA
jgi:hypothetical protein